VAVPVHDKILVLSYSRPFKVSRLCGTTSSNSMLAIASATTQNCDDGCKAVSDFGKIIAEKILIVDVSRTIKPGYYKPNVRRITYPNHLRGR
jgi:hypothetical protein